jgi:hypothetical protein
VWHLLVTLIGYGTSVSIYNKQEKMGLKLVEGKQQTNNKNKRFQNFVYNIKLC